MIIVMIAPLGMIVYISSPCSTAGLELVDNVIVWSQTREYVLNHPSGINLGAFGTLGVSPRSIPSGMIKSII